MIFVSNSLEAFREFAELTLKVLPSMGAKIIGFQAKIHVFDVEQTESVIGVSNSLEAFRRCAELILKVSPSMEAKMIGFRRENQYFRC